MEPVLNEDESYDYITRTSENLGICDVTGFISESGMHSAGSFSLGLMQMNFFYRKRNWYAGQFVKKVECIEEISEDAKLYLQTVLNGLTPRLMSYLVRDVERIFLDSDLLLPVKEDGEVDYEWMELYIRSGKNLLQDKIKSWF